MGSSLLQPEGTDFRQQLHECARKAQVPREKPPSNDTWIVATGILSRGPRWVTFPPLMHRNHEKTNSCFTPSRVQKSVSQRQKAEIADSTEMWWLDFEQCKCVYTHVFVQNSPIILSLSQLVSVVPGRWTPAQVSKSLIWPQSPRSKHNDSTSGYREDITRKLCWRYTAIHCFLSFSLFALLTEVIKCVS